MDGHASRRSPGLGLTRVLICTTHVARANNDVVHVEDVQETAKFLRHDGRAGRELGE
jgi:hypothetical protein